MATKHTCNGGKNPVWGKKTIGCARCDELLAGAAPVQGWGHRKALMEKERIHAIRTHDCKQSRCGVVCTAFDW